jgi:acyl-CoA oxidase
MASPFDVPTAEMLSMERKRSSFSVRDMTYILDGGEAKTKKNEEIYKLVENNPILRNDVKDYDLTRDQHRER